MRRDITVFLVLVVGAAFLFLWQNKFRHASLPSGAAKPDVVYSWVDSEGVTHFGQEAGKGMRLELDGSRITPLAPVGAGPAVRPDVAVEADKPRGSEALRQLRQNLQDGAQRMQAAKAAASGV